MVRMISFFIVVALTYLISLDSLRILPTKSFLKHTHVSATPTAPKPTQTPQEERKRFSFFQNYNVWQSLTLQAKTQIKEYFMARATKRGIPWKEYYDFGASNMDLLLSNYIEVADPALVYPDYYTQPFHSYADGNLNWEAALELVAATVSISANYWPTSTVAAAESWMRGNTTAAIYDHRNQYEASLSSPLPPVQQVMDIGCSIGLSTKALLEAFPQASDIAALDLSPYFLSAAKFFLGTPESPMFSQNHDKVSYHHKLAESTTFTEGTYDVVSMSYVLHEVPTATAKEIIAEAFRVLRPGGTLSIVDLNGKRIKKLPQPRRHLFELTEPHINSYYKTDPVKIMEEAGFSRIESKGNDPMNTLWLATKPAPFKSVMDVINANASPLPSPASPSPASPVGLTSLGMRLSAGALPSLPSLPSLPTLPILTPDVSQAMTPTSVPKASDGLLVDTPIISFLNFLSDDQLWGFIRLGVGFYVATLLLTDTPVLAQFLANILQVSGYITPF